MVKKRGYTRRKADKIFFSIIVLLIIVMILYYFIGLSFGQYAGFALLGMFIVLITEEIIDRVVKKPAEEFKRYNKGAKGEEFVDKKLKKLENEHIVIFDFEFPKSKENIDHIVIGKNGIFLIETKNYSFNLICNKDEWYYKPNKNKIFEKCIIKSPSSQAKRLTIKLNTFFKEKYPKLSDEWINAIVYLANEKSKLTTINEPEGCKVFRNSEKLVSYIKNYKPNNELNLTKDELIELKETLKKHCSNI